jgi:hypothetical protein
MKIQVTSLCGKRSYTERIDPEDHEGYSGDELRALEQFNAGDIDQYNGNHYIFGWWECFTQSDDVPSWMHDSELTLEFTV